MSKTDFSTVIQRFRCGWCGHPCMENGECIDPELCKDWTKDDWDNASKVHGECCHAEQSQQANQIQVTHDMAIDAGDPSLEGTYI